MNWVRLGLVQDQLAIKRLITTQANTIYQLNIKNESKPKLPNKNKNMKNKAKEMK